MKTWAIARRITQIAALVLFCLPLIMSAWALFGLYSGSDDELGAAAPGFFYGTLSSSTIGPVTLFDPLAALELFAINFFLPLSAVVGTAVVVAFYGLIRGRAFCGWVCPVNLLGEGVEALRTKLNIPVAEHMLPRRTKIGVAAVFVLLSALVGMPVFEAISPIGAVNKGIVLGGFAGLGTLCAVLIADLFVSKRLWCRALCPLGGVYQAIGRVGLVKVHLDHEACIHCDKCTQACLCDPEILKPALEGKESIVSAGDCMACGACIDMCPTKALSFGVGGRFKAAQKHELAGDK